MSHRRWNIWIILSLLALLPGCGPYMLKPDQEVEAPVVTLRGMGTDYVALIDQRYVLKFDVYNPNPFGLPVEGFSYHIVMNGEMFGRGIVNKHAVIEPHQSMEFSGEIIGKDLEWALPFAPEDKQRMGNFNWELYGGFILLGHDRTVPYVNIGYLKAPPEY